MRSADTSGLFPAAFQVALDDFALSGCQVIPKFDCDLCSVHFDFRCFAFVYFVFLRNPGGDVDFFGGGFHFVPFRLVVCVSVCSYNIPKS